ncbi:MAG: T9SS type A sorting domain-containing protein [Bacteroidetes bacterium]|nr:T9SS type A sorting domain-containing protein [Bacteroidota bacterium]
MNKTLLFAILALSINAFAQNQRSPLNSMGNVLSRMENTERKPFHLSSDTNLWQFIKHQIPDQRTLIQIYDSAFHWQWDTITYRWKIATKTINVVYDSKNNLISYLGQRKSGSVWENSLQYFASYNAWNNPATQIYKSWNGTAWVNLWQYFFIYDANNNETSYLWQSWNGGAWVNESQNIYAYDGNNNRITNLLQRWNGSAWENLSQYNYTYDANNNCTGELKQIWNSAAWENSSQYIFTYDNNNSLTSELWQSWYDNTWMNTSQYTYNYDVNLNLTNKLRQNWNGAAWVNFWQYTFSYNVGNNPENIIQQSWNGSQWVNFSQYAYTYDANNFETSYSLIYWNSSGVVVSSGDSAYFYFHTISGINDLMAKEGNTTVYPNPTTGKVTISSNNNISSALIYSLYGECTYSDFKFSQETSINLSDYSKGIYVIKIQCGSKIYTRKIVVQ